MNYGNHVLTQDLGVGGHVWLQGTTVATIRKATGEAADSWCENALRVGYIESPTGCAAGDSAGSVVETSTSIASVTPATSPDTGGDSPTTKRKPRSRKRG